MSDIVRWIESIKDTTDKAIAKLRFLKAFPEELTEQEIAEELSIPQTTISYRLRKLKKSMPPI